MLAVAEHERRVHDAEPRVPCLEVVERVDEQVLRARDKVLELRRDRLAEFARVENLNLDFAVGQLFDALGEELGGLPLIGCRRQDMTRLQPHRRFARALPQVQE